MRNVVELAHMSQPSRAPELIRLQGVGLADRGTELLTGIDLDIRRELTVILGPNGAGKSLLLRLIQGLIAPSAGKVTRAASRVSLVTQHPVLLRRSVSANLDHALKLYGVPRAERRDRIATLLRRGRLGELANRPARVLSGGEQQRLAILRALAAEPALLLLDEPASHLDPQSTALIEQLVAEAGCPFVLVTHDIGQARRMADRVVFLNRGRLVEDRDAASFFQAPETLPARAYLKGDLLL